MHEDENGYATEEVAEGWECENENENDDSQVNEFASERGGGKNHENDHHDHVHASASANEALVCPNNVRHVRPHVPPGGGDGDDVGVSGYLGNEIVYVDRYMNEHVASPIDLVHVNDCVLHASAHGHGHCHANAQHADRYCQR